MFPVLEKASLRVNSEMTGCMAGGANGRREAQSPSRHPPPKASLMGLRTGGVSGGGARDLHCPETKIYHLVKGTHLKCIAQ